VHLLITWTYLGNPKALNEALQELDNTAHEIGLLRSQEKHKKVSINKKTHNQCKQIGIGGYRFEEFQGVLI